MGFLELEFASHLDCWEMLRDLSSLEDFLDLISGPYPALWVGGVTFVKKNLFRHHYASTKGAWPPGWYESVMLPWESL